jgi:hypothetical protein
MSPIAIDQIGRRSWKLVQAYQFVWSVIGVQTVSASTLATGEARPTAERSAAGCYVVN